MSSPSLLPHPFSLEASSPPWDPEKGEAEEEEEAFVVHSAISFIFCEVEFRERKSMHSSALFLDFFLEPSFLKADFAAMLNTYFAAGGHKDKEKQ